MKKVFRVLVCIGIVLCGIAYLIRMPVPTVSIEDQSSKFVSGKSLESHVKKLSQELLPRTCTEPLRLQKTANYIKSQFEKWNSNTSYQHYRHGNGNFSNVISEFGPDTHEILIVGAHYDAFMPYPGANDNASGVAGLLELNRLFSKIELSSRVVLVAYSCEEPPHYAGSGMGSVVHAKSIAGRQVSLMISLEMIGYYSSEKNSQDYPAPVLSLLYPNKGDFIAIAGNLFTLDASRLKTTINRVTDLNAYSINAPRSIPGIDFSDHRSYWALNYPAIMVTDAAFYRYKHYHKLTDTFEKLDYKKMEKVVYGIYLHIVNLANKT